MGNVPDAAVIVDAPITGVARMDISPRLRTYQHIVEVDALKRSAFLEVVDNPVCHDLRGLILQVRQLNDVWVEVRFHLTVIDQFLLK